MAAIGPGVDASGAVSALVLAIGRPSFPDVLIDTLRTVADVGHCMVFTFESQRSARCLLSAGNIAIGPDLGAAYSEHFYSADPNRDMIFRQRAEARPILLPNFARRMYPKGYRKLFFEDSAIVDKAATAIWVGDHCTYVNFYRTAAQGGFAPDERQRITAAAPLIGAIVARHGQERGAAIDPADKLAVLFAAGGPLSVLTAREKDVCRRILEGFSSEAIAGDLGIALNSVFTYRKRAYEKLGIASQNELFAIALRLMTAPQPLN
ncbi:helix-turn-helix transcriptional regulator [Bradyrhizobium sp. SSBR45G]|uniref:helix-turn-helix transcriptional regulator n=1 Tax=unclassified Bradyrhizobium TaxID=2631580 RepID=UPI002342A293|nr:MULTISPECIES: helix-turn-helix transcriptional regulator [unclassified Bradyrhizobium]GLH78236.1 helix-turn-helix transcriptional regulator [Bradyrhizobium sp. SSBR45G]GLH85997.1 helix-turn-helix transcriptional regulator [Bradyrhizobium sp. SSBR45R]